MDADKVKEICKPNQIDCCSYLAVDPTGFICCKTNSLKFIIDQRRAEGTMRAMGDNCPGYDNEKKEYI